MGTASTMASITEALGLTLPGAATIPAVHSAHARMATAAGRRAVEMVWEDLRPSHILTADAFRNGVVTDMALCGSTNAIIHLIAMARRAGVRFDDRGLRSDLARDAGRREPSARRRVPDGGLPRCGRRAGVVAVPRLAPRARLPDGRRTRSARTSRAPRVFNERGHPCRSIDRVARGRPVVLRGNLAPDGCVIKPTAAEPRLLKHAGRQWSSRTTPTSRRGSTTGRSRCHGRSRRGAAERRADRRAGHAGMGHAAHSEEAACSRASATWCASRTRGCPARAYGTCVLHVAPESSIGGPLALGARW